MTPYACGYCGSCLEVRGEILHNEGCTAPPRFIGSVFCGFDMAAGDDRTVQQWQCPDCLGWQRLEETHCHRCGRAR